MNLFNSSLQNLKQEDNLRRRNLNPPQQKNGEGTVKQKVAKLDPCQKIHLEAFFFGKVNFIPYSDPTVLQMFNQIWAPVTFFGMNRLILPEVTWV